MDIGSIEQHRNLTDIGLKMSQFPLDPHLAKMLLMGEEFNYVNEVLAIVSMHSVLSTLKDQAEESDAAHARFFVLESDHLTFLNIYKQWKKLKIRFT
ncbi:HA2 domain-containing protein [Artemisia annua]|uniref:RNA helicase n=1 Tax=Artemisia annua TaxID=35608 RepID=A0A2U1NNP6_ARTAN|nr:HA2 domain-containing protein [Artemisia annua]